MSLALGVALVLAHACVGWAPARAWGAPLVGSSRLGRLALSVGLGSLIVGLVQIAVVGMGWPARGPTVAALAALGGVVSWRGRKTRTSRSSVGASVAARDAVDPGVVGSPGPEGTAGGQGGGSASPLGVALGLWLALVVLVCGLVSVGLPFSADGSKFWAPKARDLAVVGAHAAPSLTAADELGFHRDYPLLVPVLLAPAFAHGPPDGHAGPKLVLVAPLLALLVVLTLALARRSRWLAAALLGVPMLVATHPGSSVGAGGYADGVLALCLALFVHAVDRLRRRPASDVEAPAPGGAQDDGAAAAGALALAVLAGAGLLATKLEGSVAALIVAVAWILQGPRRGAWLPVALGVVVLSAPTLWLRTLTAADPPISDPSLLLDGSVLAARAVPLALGLGAVLVDVSALGLAPLAVWIAADRRSRSPLLVWIVLGLTAFLAVVYLSTTMHLGRHLQTSLARLVFQWLPALALLAVAGADGPRGALAAADGVSAPRAVGGHAGEGDGDGAIRDRGDAHPADRTGHAESGAAGSRHGQ